MRRKSAFTLVELLVVVGIIALLIAILLPVLGRAREASNRVKCAANLHNIGLAAIQFANEHGATFPPAYQLPGAAYPYRFPNVLSRDDALENPAAPKWKTHGTPFGTWQKYGTTEASWTCPSAAYAEVKAYGDATAAPDEWGEVLWTHYMYVAGITTANKGKSANNWGTAVPAVKYNERQAAEHVLAADMVYYSGGGSTKWDKVRPRYMINHQNPKVHPPLPGFQNVLYGDGHVEGKGPESFPTPLNTSNNWSLLHAGSGVGGYFYWGPTMTDRVLNPPPPPKPNPNPNPNPPKPPTTPPPTPVLPTPLPQ